MTGVQTCALPISIFFKIDPEHSLQRLSSRSKLEIYEKMHMQKLVDIAYETTIAQKRSRGGKIETVNAEKPIDQVRQEVFTIIEAYTGFTIA